MKLQKTTIIYIILLAVTFCKVDVFAQFDVGGEFRLRYYNDIYSQLQTDKKAVSYTRMLARINTSYKASDMVTFNAEVMNLADTSTSPARGISGTGPIHFGVSQLYAELKQYDFYGFDIVRLRAGRQQFSIGDGLSFGESYYYYDKFDGGRLDVSYDPFTLTLFGAIYGQSLSTNGLWPQEASDNIYVAKLGAKVLDQDVMIYGINNRPRGEYNDSYIIGGGSAGSFLNEMLDYSGEVAYQKFNKQPGGLDKAGLGYMGSLGYSFSAPYFKRIKFETKYAAMQGDDPATSQIEQFSPAFPDFEFGERTGFVNGVIGGSYPHDDKYAEGSRIWYSRLYFIPKDLPKFRVQFQYTMVKPYTDRVDGYNQFDDEFQVKLYYMVNSRVQFQVRYERIIPNGADADLNKNGVISSTEDRNYLDSYMVELRVKF